MSPGWHFAFAIVFLVGAQVFKKPASDVQDNVKVPPMTASAVVFFCYLVGGLSAVLGIMAMFLPE